ncbi:unnamed protein product [Musa banksii]
MHAHLPSTPSSDGVAVEWLPRARTPLPWSRGQHGWVRVRMIGDLPERPLRPLR